MNVSGVIFFPFRAKETKKKKKTPDLRLVAGYPTCQVNVIKLKREILWTGGLPHLPGLPHPYVNRALNHTTVANALLLLSRMKSS